VRREHAIHNEAACDFLLQSGDFNDWVITTAFYSALHFVHDALFPIEHEGETFQDLNVYYDKVLKPKNRKLTKHAAIITMVKANLNNSARYYRWLYDACMNARYTDYIVTNQKALLARKYLNELKVTLDKK